MVRPGPCILAEEMDFLWIVILLERSEVVRWRCSSLSMKLIAWELDWRGDQNLVLRAWWWVAWFNSSSNLFVSVH